MTNIYFKDFSLEIFVGKAQLDLECFAVNTSEISAYLHVGRRSQAGNSCQRLCVFSKRQLEV